jgi:hypothetical protein
MEQDVRHVLVLHCTYKLPFNLKKQSTFTSSIATHLPTDRPYRNSALSERLPIMITAIANGELNPSGPVMSSVFNMAALSDPVNSFGNLPPASSNLRNFPVLSESFGVTKNAQLTEHLNWVFYSQFFNAFNRHRFTTINAKYR